MIAVTLPEAAWAGIISALGELPTQANAYPSWIEIKRQVEAGQREQFIADLLASQEPKNDAPSES